MPPGRLPLPLSGQAVIQPYGGDIDEDIASIGTIKAANAITGGLSKPSKMPEYGYSIPARHCQTGARLQEIRGTVCQRCYALTRRFLFENVQNAMQRRFESLPHPLWVPAMVLLIRRRFIKHLRLHDSGDVQNGPHLRNLALIAENTPDTLIWLPTREYQLVTGYVEEYGDFPDNLTVRVSAHLIDAPPPAGFANTSTVTASKPKRADYVCPAPDQQNKCSGVIADCRACWNREIKNVSYWLH